MILIAKGKFSQPRKPRQDLDSIPEYVSPIQESVQDSSMEETRLLTGVFQPIRDAQPPVPAPEVPVPQETMTFEEAEFIHQTTVYNTEASMISDQLDDDDDDDDDDYDYEEELRQRKRAAARKNAKRRKILWISIACVSVLLIAALALGAVMLLSGTKDDGLILNNVTVAGVNIGGMTPEEAAAAIHRATDMTYTVEDMVIYLPDTILELSPKDTKVKLDVDAAVEAAFNYGRTGTAEENRKAQADSLISNHTIALLPYLSLDTDYIRQVLDEYGSSFNSIYEESSWELVGEMPKLEADEFDEKAEPQVLVLIPGQPGRNVDIEGIYNNILDAYSMNEFEVKVEMTDKEMTPEAIDLEAIYEQLHSEAVDASMDMETFEVTPEVYGYTFDLEEAQKLLAETPYGEQLEIPMEYIIPEVLSKDLDEKLFRDVLASVETPHTSDANRNTNLKLACAAINNYVLMPGDTFDYNKVLGERTEEKGYKPAGALSAGTSTTEVGGGICQVSSTLYYGCLLSDLEIVTRRSHSLPSSYMPMMGIDATVSWGGPDFRFKNNTDYPIRIEAEVSGGKVKVKLIGTDEKTYYIKMEYKTVEVISPKTIEETYTAAEAKAKGYKDGQVKQQGSTGYTVYSYKCKYDKETDKLISRDYEATSNYVKKDKIIIRVIPDETEPPETQAPTEPPVTEPPVTEPPVTEPPVTEPPVTEPPITNPPVVTEPPAPPVTEPDNGGGVSEGGETP